jgi:gluconate 2-dehydrogenase subunit 3-like protein
MNRRESLKALSITTLAGGVLLDACNTPPGKDVMATKAEKERPDRLPEEIEREKKLHAETFFTPHELATVTVLADIIIPRDEKSGSASDAKVPEFIEFMMKDRPENQVPMRGGIRWVDMQCFKRFGKAFVDCATAQQCELVEDIAYPEAAKPEMQPGVAFFDRIRALTASGFFTTKMGIDDLGYVGNRPNKWEGVPADIIKQYGLEDVAF